MGYSFRVHDLRKEGQYAEYDELNRYLRMLHLRFHNAMFAETRVYTCRSWRMPGGVTAPYELHWNADAVPGEVLLGKFGWSVGRELVDRIEGEFAKGESVRLFIFNSDADLQCEEVLEPTHTQA